MNVKKGSKIKVDYEGKFESGEVFDTSQHEGHSHPLEFEVGSGQVIKGFDDAVIGMKKDEEKEFSIEAKEAYGERDERAVQKIPRKVLPKDQKPEEGMIIVMGTPDGKQFPAKITKVEKDFITIDLNHPLAGKKLIFKIKIVDII